MGSFASIAAAVTVPIGIAMLTGVLALPRVGLALVRLSESEAAEDRAAPSSPRELDADHWIRIRRAACRAIACLLVAPLVLTTAATPGWSKDKPTRFWNLTGDTVTHLTLAPAGTDAYGPDQCANDRDGTVDFDERLPITGIAPGRYDVRLDLRTGRRCRVRNVEIQAGEVFSVEAGDLTDCGP